MHFLIIFLHLFDLVTLVLDVVWLLIAIHIFGWQKCSPLCGETVLPLHPPHNFLTISSRPAIARTINALLNSLPLPQPDTNERKTRPTTVLHKPAFALHNLMYLIMRRRLNQLPLAEPTASIPFLRGARFALLANMLISDEYSPTLATFGIKLGVHEHTRVRFLASLPEISVTPPDDGDRVPERGQKGGKRLKFVKGLLAPPGKISKAARPAKERRRAEKKAREMAKRK